MRTHLLGIAVVAGFGLIGGGTAHAWVGEGRMNGGGNFDCGDFGKVTFGYTLHCAPGTGPNNFEINWGGGNNFHLTELTNAICLDNPAFSPNPPAAPLDTFFATGTGLFNNTTEGTIFVNLTDQGEPGTSDTISVTIYVGGEKVLDCNTIQLSGGNNQALPEQP